MTNRLLRYSQASPVALSQNRAHGFAVDHAMAIYGKDTVFTFIPKNACSTLRYSAALANQVIDGPDGIRWIHNNNSSFRPTQAELVTAKYTFVVLRCPYERLVSCFLNHIAEARTRLDLFLPDAPPRQSRAGRAVERISRKLGTGRPEPDGLPPDSLTFAEFVRLLERPGALTSDIHWRPQTDFLVYRRYDDFFPMSDMDRMIAAAREKAGFEIHDARPLTLHGNDRRERMVGGSYGHTDIRSLRELKAQMKAPAYETLFTSDLRDRVSALYEPDIALYSEAFGRSALMPRP